MKKLILGLTLLATQHLFSQDSIYKKNGEIIPSKILEISDAQVKFKKINNLEGPSYSELKSEIFRIKFENGSVDTIIHKEVIQEVIVQSSPVPNSGFPTKQSLMYRKLNDRELFLLIVELPASTQKNKMLTEYKKMRQFKAIQYLSTGLGFGIGFAVPVVVTYAVLANESYSNNSDPVTYIVAGALTGAAIRTVGQVLFHVNKNKKLNARKNLMLMYDQLN